jgi:hypothetical protein
MATLLVVTASPAMAQTFFVDRGDFDRLGNVGPTSQEFSIRRIRSGAANPVTNISNTGSNVNLCPTTQQVVTTGNVANEQGVVLGPGTTAPEFVTPTGFFVDGIFVPVDRGFFFEPTTGDIDFEGSNITVDGSVSGSCTQTIEQAAAAGR